MSNQNQIEKQKSLIVESLKKIPVKTLALQKAGVSRPTFYRWRSEDGKFAEDCLSAEQEGIESVNDMTEVQLLQMSKEKHWPATRLWLISNHPRFMTRDRIQMQRRKEEGIELSQSQKQLLIKALKLFN